MTAFAAPASAAPDGSTEATFCIDGGTLDITVPASATWGNAVIDGSYGVPLGTISVNDQRAALVGSWITTAVSSAFVTGNASPEETIQDGVTYNSTEPYDVVGNGTLQPELMGVSIETPAPVMSKLDGAGNNSVSWDPWMFIIVPADAVAGVYAGTIVHSVA